MSKYTLLFFLSFHCLSFAQNATVKTPIELQREARNEAKKHIQLLQKSVILFRLDSKSEQIAYYEKYGNFNAAEKLRKEVRKDNLRIIQAFRKGFTFCPIYFFEDRYSVPLSQGHLDSIIFYTDSLQADLTIHLPEGTNYYIAEFGMTRDDDDNKFRSDYYIDSDSTGTTQKIRYHDDGNLGLTGFVLMDAHFNQLQRPFPYYARIASVRIPLDRLVTKAKSWSTELTKFYATTE